MPSYCEQDDLHPKCEQACHWVLAGAQAGATLSTLPRQRRALAGRGCCTTPRGTPDAPTHLPPVADEQPEEMIPGEIPAPVISLGNPDVVLHHLSAIAFGAADPGLAGRNFPPARAIPCGPPTIPSESPPEAVRPGEDLHLPASTNEANGPKHSTVGSALETADFQASCVGF